MTNTFNKETAKGAELVQVPSMRLDDIIMNLSEKIFLAKVDTQGFEPMVLSGLTKSLEEHRIQFLLMEYWPRGMDLLAGEPDACVGAKLLQSLVNSGYTLFELKVAAHPRAPQGWKKLVDTRPFTSLEENCRWYFNVEKQLPSEEYKMGYWSDVVAVAPDADLGADASTPTGVALKNALSSMTQR